MQDENNQDQQQDEEELDHQIVKAQHQLAKDELLHPKLIKSIDKYISKQYYQFN